MRLDPSKCNEKLRQKIEAADREQNPRRVGAVETVKSKPAPLPALAGGPRKQAKGSPVLAIVHFTAQVRRLLDDDNLVGSIKPLRDAVAKSLAIDDGDKRIKWEYGQMKTEGEEGVMVKIQVLPQTEPPASGSSSPCRAPDGSGTQDKHQSVEPSP